MQIGIGIGVGFRSQSQTSAQEPVVDELLLEDGFKILQEDGSSILLEQQ